MNSANFDQTKEEPQSPIIDFHVHLIDYDWYTPSTYERLTTVNAVNEKNAESFEAKRKKYKDPEVFVQYLRECGVDYAVILGEASPITTGIVSNQKVAEFCRNYDCLIPFGSLNPYMETNSAKSLENLVVNQGFRGLKLYPTYQHFYPNDRQIYPLYAVAQELDIPIMFHTGSSVFTGSRMKYGDPLFFDDVAVDFPDLKLLMVHSGRGFWYDRAYFLSRLHPNLYMEIAGLPPKKMLDYFPEFERNAEKIIFGSDWPDVSSISHNVEEIRRLPIKEESTKKILGENAARILGLK